MAPPSSFTAVITGISASSPLCTERKGENAQKSELEETGRTGVFGNIAQMAFVFQPCSSCTDMVGGTVHQQRLRPHQPANFETYHFPFTLIKQVISSISLAPSLKILPKGSKISNLAESGEMAISVSGTGSGLGLGE